MGIVMASHPIPGLYFVPGIGLVYNIFTLYSTYSSIASYPLWYHVHIRFNLRLTPYDQVVTWYQHIFAHRALRKVDHLAYFARNRPRNGPRSVRFGFSSASFFSF